MSKFRAIKTSFNGGEISKQLFGRVDLESFIASNKQMKNVLPTIYGSAINRGGTVFVNDNIKHFWEALQEVTGATNINCVSIDYGFSHYVFGCDNGYLVRCDFDFSNIVIKQLERDGAIGDILSVAQTSWYNDRNSYKVSTTAGSYLYIPEDALWSNNNAIIPIVDRLYEKLIDGEMVKIGTDIRNSGNIYSFDGLKFRVSQIRLDGSFDITDTVDISDNSTNDFDGFYIGNAHYIVRNENNLWLVYYYDSPHGIAVSLGTNAAAVIGAKLDGDDNVCVFVYKQIDGKYCICADIYNKTDGSLVQEKVIASYDSDIGTNKAIVTGDKVIFVGSTKSVCLYKNTVFNLDFAATCLNYEINVTNDKILYCTGGDDVHILTGYNYADVNTKRVLIPFRVNKLINYVVEFGNNVVRFYKNRQLVLNNDGTPYEISSLYGINDLIDSEGKLKINYVQSVDVLYICSKDFPIQVLKRYGDANWVIEDFSMVGGPFGDTNSNKAISLTCSGGTGVQTVNATKADYQCTITASTSSESTLITWYLDNVSISQATKKVTINNIVDLLYSSANGSDFVITTDGNKITVNATAAGYANKVLKLKVGSSGGGHGSTPPTPSGGTSYTKTATFTGGSSTDVFVESDAGKLIRLNYVDTNTVMWESGKSITSGAIRKSGNNYYKATSSGTTGQIKPVHTEGTVSDGGVNWKYLHSGYGIGTIVEVVSASQVKVNVDGYMPDLSGGTNLWELGIVGGGVYPNCCALYKERFVFSISTSNGTKICASCAGDYNNFSDNSYGDILPENAITVLLQGNQESMVLWMAAMNKLYIGTACEEFIFGEQTIAEVLSPTNVMCVKVSSLGSAAIMPLHILDELFFVSNNEKQIANFTYISERDSFRPTNISVMFEHLLYNGVKCWAYTCEPYKTIWFSDKEGNLRSVSYDADNKVCAGARHDVGGKIVSLAVIPEPNGNYDELWMIVERVVAGQTVYYTERLSWGLPQENVTDEYKNKYQIYSDCAKVVEFDDDVSEVGGLYFLEGKTVKVLVDGKVQTDKTVVDGSITLDDAGKVVVVGAGYNWLIETLYINIGANDGTAQGLPQRVSKLIARVINTRYFKAKASGGNRYDFVCDKDELTDDDFEIHLPSEYSRKMTMFFEGDKPVSCCLLMLVGEMRTYQ